MVPAMTAANRIAAVLFAVCAAVQLNDSDWAVWFGFYAGAFALCVAWEQGLLKRRLAGSVAIATLGVAAWWAWTTSSAGSFAPDLAQWGMTDGQTERVREAGGLVLVGLWATALAWTTPARRSNR